VISLRDSEDAQVRNATLDGMVARSKNLKESQNLEFSL